jgi:hypothetical protein
LFERRHAIGLVAAVWGTVTCAGACGGGGTQNVLFTDAGPGGSGADGSLPEAGLPALCVPGQQIACTCAGGAAGDQVCLSDGRSYGPCEGCAPESDSPAPPPLDAASNKDSAGPVDSAAGDTGTVTKDAAGDAKEPLDDGEAADALADAPADAPRDAADACVADIIATSRQPVAMLFLLDGSGSMTTDNKWTAATGALTNVFSDMASKNDPGLYAGLIVFSDTNDITGGGILGMGGGPYPGTNDVPIAPMNAAHLTALEARYGNGDMPSGATPTQAVLQGGYTELEGFGVAGASPKKALILLTDGVPTDNCAVVSGNYVGDACIVQAGTELTKASPAGPIETFAIGVGIYPATDLTNFDPSFLGNLAKSGGSGPTGCNPNENTAAATDLCYFEVNPSGSSTATQAAFEAAINRIRNQITSCTFAFATGDAGTIDPSRVYVTFNGATVPEDPTNGWTFDNPLAPTSVTLHGTSCSTAQTTPLATVNVVEGCGGN